MADFKKAYARTREFEGGYSNHGSDTGGETYKGIARNSNPKWKGWAIVDRYRKLPNFPANLDGDASLQEHVHALYKVEYWNTLNLDKAKNQDIAEELFDTAVNMGVSVAGAFIQRVLNVANRGEKYFPNLKVDGVCGPVTIGALNRFTGAEEKNIWVAFNCLKGNRYVEICERNESQEVFFHGWMKRVFVID